MREPEKPPIFILSVGRSGTTLLSLILDSHPEICVGRESNFMRAMHILYADPDENRPPVPVTHPLNLTEVDKEWYRKYGLSRGEFTAYLRRFIDSFFTDYAVRRGKKRWGDKSPRNAPYHNLMYEIFPDAKFIHLVRDPRAVCYSWRMLAANANLREIAMKWRETNISIASFGSKIPQSQYLRVRYEDLVVHPRETVSKILSFVDAEWSEDVMRHEEISPEKFARHDVQKGIDWVKTKIAADKPVLEGGARNNPGRKIDTDSIDLWMHRLRKSEIRMIQKITSNELKQFGYSTAVGLIPLIGRVRLNS